MKILQNLIKCSLSLLLALACSEKKDLLSQGKKLAQVGKQELFFAEVKSAMPPQINSQDSAEFVTRYVENWIRKQLLYQKAEKEVKINEKELQKRLDEYRFALLTYEFEKQYVAKKFSDSISEQEIKDFYEKNKQEFELRQNIVKAIFIKVSKTAEIEKLKKLMLSDMSEDKNELLQFCNEKAISYYLKDSVWIDFDELTQLTPFESIPNKVNFLKNNKISQMQDGDFVYILAIKDYKISEQISPLEFVRERIKSMILNQRKTLLIKQLEDELYKEAQKNKSFQIFK
ncbi:MAG: peptidylprolyl isomerase [Raineya sp.]|nr:peptidylprolyl isomerase [Raineya sp.]